MIHMCGIGSFRSFSWSALSIWHQMPRSRCGVQATFVRLRRARDISLDRKIATSCQYGDAWAGTLERPRCWNMIDTSLMDVWEPIHRVVAEREPVFLYQGRDVLSTTMERWSSSTPRSTHR